MKIKSIAFFLAIAFLVACSPTLPPPTTGGTLSLEQLLNGTWISPQTGRTITLVDGVYASGSDPSAADYLQARLNEPVVFGDLDYDGAQDAVFVLAENTGGTGTFVSLVAVLNRNGKPFQAAFITDAFARIGNLVIQSGEILLDATTYGEQDPTCCPSSEVALGYRLYGNQMVQTRLERKLGDGGMRSIEISSPVDLAEVSYPITVTGSVTVGPFENTLAYNVYDAANVLVTASSTMTDSADMGLPGNFQLTVDLTTVGVTGRLRIEVVEYSMKDGSILVLDSVLVKVR